MVVRHGVPSVRDFTTLHETVDRSLTTLRQLGSSRYSTAMRAQLLEWFRIVDGAAAAVDVLRAAQEKWLTQDMVLSSMAFEEEVPFTFQLFKALRLSLFLHTLHKFMQFFLQEAIVFSTSLFP